MHKGLGEMQAGRGRGRSQARADQREVARHLGEVQLARLIEDNMTPDQYASNIKPVPGSDAIVEFAVRLPGKAGGAPVWLPIDAKFPRRNTSA